MPEVFISYGRKNRDLVEPLATWLEKLGVVAWMDSGIQAGERYRREIRSQLKDAKAVVVCWTPDALDSDWVDYEADIALEYGTYVPVFLAPCALQPPFNGYQTPDLSKWSDEKPADPQWLLLVEKIAEKIGREGVIAAARAIGSSDEQARYDFAKRYPEEPVAKRLWLAYETRHKEEFNKLVADARDRVRARINQEYVDLDNRLAAALPELETWLSAERCGAAKAPRPDPSVILESRDKPDETKLRSEIASLSGSLAKSRDHEGQLNAELSRLSRELAEAAEETKRLQKEGLSLRQELNSVKAEMERVSQQSQLAAHDRDRLRAQNETAAADLKARSLELDATMNAAAAELKARKQELDAANALITRFTAEIEAARETRRAATSAPEKPPAAGSTSSPEKNKSATNSRFWKFVWPIGMILTLILALTFFTEVNSRFYSDRQNAPSVFISLLIVLLFSIFAYRRSRPRKGTQ
jgi:hypothetical protein